MIGEGEKYCAALLFLAPGSDLAEVEEEILKGAQEANRALPEWSQAKRALLLTATLNADNNLLTPTLKVKRSKVMEHYDAQIAELFGRDVQEAKRGERGTKSANTTPGTGETGLTIEIEKR